MPQEWDLRFNQKDLDRLAKYLVIREEGCWGWTGAKNKKGYGAFGIRGKVGLIHRLVYEHLSSERIPKGMQVAHHCDNPECARYDHLYLATPKQNSGDMVKRKRSAFGERNPRAILREDEVIAMRNLRKKGYLLREIADMMGVHIMTVSAICARRRWAHLKETN